MKVLPSLAALLVIIAHMVLLTGAIGYYRRFMGIFKLPYYHGFWALLVLPVMAFALSVFRVFQGIDTRIIKYLHAILHVIPIFIIYHSLRDLEDPQWHYMHGKPAYYVFYGYIAQIIVSLVLFCALPKGNVRNVIAGLHSVVGIWLYHCYVGVALTGIHSCSIHYEGFYKKETYRSGVEVYGCVRLMDFYKSLIIVAATILNILLILPFFQWEEVAAW